MTAHRVIVAGAGGYIGRHLVARLVAEAWSVAAFVRPASPLRSEFTGQVTPLTATDWSLDGLLRSADGTDFDVIVNLAAYGVAPADRDVGQMVAVNAMLPATLVRLAAARRAAIVTLGSCSEYARSDDRTLSEHAPLETTRLYGASKAAGGLLATAVATECDVPCRHLRLFNVYGPGEAAHRLLPSLVDKLRRGESVALSEGRQLRDFVMIDDVIDAIVAACRVAIARQGPVADTLNVCTGVARSVRDFASTVGAILGAPSSLLRFGEIGMRKDELQQVVGDPMRTTHELGWTARYSLDDGLSSATQRQLEMGGT